MSASTFGGLVVRGGEPSNRRTNRPAAGCTDPQEQLIEIRHRCSARVPSRGGRPLAVSVDTFTPQGRGHAKANPRIGIEVHSARRARREQATRTPRQHRVVDSASPQTRGEPRLHRKHRRREATRIPERPNSLAFALAEIGGNDCGRPLRRACDVPRWGRGNTAASRQSAARHRQIGHVDSAS